ncbi:hypothetical protein [Chitinophaga rhizophila]|uniref:Uncharacterized protein n=1 Tax=Chitinophaga rhizophila TaxID=2866212 RepID=A0ABS7GCS6_9BACT|nr:hypothetical protein [Chitinophaga rhizophila]MBW8685221.1 hypothetical protein [Chitinophaga rhizophila]
MKKGIFSLAFAVIAIILIAAFSLRSEKTTASASATANIQALAPVDQVPGYTGPRPQGGHCESRNNHACGDSDSPELPETPEVSK